MSPPSTPYLLLFERNTPRHNFQENGAIRTAIRHHDFDYWLKKINDRPVRAWYWAINPIENDPIENELDSQQDKKVKNTNITSFLKSVG